MAAINIPYSKKYLKVNIDDGRIAGILEPEAVMSSADSCKTETDLINEAMNSPVSSVTLEQLAKGKRNVVIITSDHTRPVPSKLTMPVLLSRLRKGNPDIKIDILVSTGCHRETTREELIDKMGEAIVNNENIIIHVATDKENMVKVGRLPSGGELWLNKLVMSTDLLIAEGFIEPHFFAGFSGGRKSVLPGVAMAETVMANHCAEFIASPYARTGILENNPIHEDMIYAAKTAKLQFILNVVLDGNKKVIAAFAGDAEAAHYEGRSYVKKMCMVEPVPADIVITSNGGYPLDQNIYQAVKGMTAAEATCREGGVIIMVAACNDGHGGESFYKCMSGGKSPREILEETMKIDRVATKPDQWQYQILVRILDKYTVIMVTDMCDPQMIRDMQMKHAFTIEEAIRMAGEIAGVNAKITVIPDGIGVIVNSNS